MEFIGEFVLIYPFYTIMFGHRGDISTAGVGILLAAWQIVTVAAEIPTGILADKISKKWSLFIGKSLRTAAFGIWLFVPDFWGYLSGFILWGIGDAFHSGAFQAYVYESLDGEKKHDFNKIYSRISSVTMLAFTLAYILSFFVGPNFDLLLFWSVVVSIITALICLSLPETRKTQDIELKPQLLMSTLLEIKSSQKIRSFLIGAIIIQSLAIMIIEYMPLYYTQAGIEERWVPLFLAAGNALTVILLWVMHRYERLLVEYQLFIIGIISLGLVMSFYQSPLFQVAG